MIGARLHVGVALPVAPVAQQVVLEGGEAGHQRALSRRTAAGAGRRATRTPRRSAPRAAAPVACPRRVKNSSLAMARAPSVSPCSGNSSTRSTSEEKFSSPPPSLPMPMTTSGCALAGRGARLAVARHQRRRAPWATAVAIAASAKAVSSASVSGSCAQPARSRQAMRTSSWRRQRAQRCLELRLGDLAAPRPRAGRAPAYSAAARLRSRSPAVRAARTSSAGSRAQDCADEVAGGEHVGQGCRGSAPAPRAARSLAASLACAAPRARARGGREAQLLIPAAGISSRCCRRDRGTWRCPGGGSDP